MICTSVVTCLSNGLDKNNRIMFVPFSRLYVHVVSLAFFENRGNKPHTKAVKKNFFVHRYNN